PNNWEPPKLVADGSIPTRFELMGNYPNPFNATTEIQYALPFNAHVTLEIYDILGRKTSTLIDEYQEAGYKTVHWNGIGDNGMEVSTGIYIYRLSSAGLSRSKRMLMLK
ncbi:MAG: T9SS type A sorting domain-containing protein, partial [Candidatus Zixiibacteriota bacterium]